MLLTRLPPWRAAKYNVHKHKNIHKYTLINIDRYRSGYQDRLIQLSSHTAFLTYTDIGNLQLHSSESGIMLLIRSTAASHSSVLNYFNTTNTTNLLR